MSDEQRLSEGELALLLKADADDPSTWTPYMQRCAELAAKSLPECALDDGDDFANSLAQCAVTRNCAGHAALVSALFAALQERISGTALHEVVRALDNAVSSYEVELTDEALRVGQRLAAVLPDTTLDGLVLKLMAGKPNAE